MKIGYACINMTLAALKIQVNRTMVKKTFLTKGIEFASELALKNIQDLSKLIDWNIKNNLKFYRLSSDMFPWMSEYLLKDLPQFEEIKKVLKRVGEKAKLSELRLTFHPGPFNVLASGDERIIINTIKELSQHGDIMDLMELENTPYSKINIHVGATYNNKEKSLDQFAANFLKLPFNVRSRLTVENDDKESMYSVKDLLLLHEKIKIPIVFDYLHHKFCNSGLSEQEALEASISTWPRGIVPVVHYSSSKKYYESKLAAETAHADYIYQHIPLYNKQVDIMIEAKAKEKAVIKYMEEYRVKLNY